MLLSKRYKPDPSHQALSFAAMLLTGLPGLLFAPSSILAPHEMDIQGTNTFLIHPISLI
jgi:hypothetical protein